MRPVVRTQGSTEAPAGLRRGRPAALRGSGPLGGLASDPIRVLASNAGGIDFGRRTPPRKTGPIDRRAIAAGGGTVNANGLLAPLVVPTDELAGGVALIAMQAPNHFVRLAVEGREEHGLPGVRPAGLHAAAAALRVLHQNRPPLGDGVVRPGLRSNSPGASVDCASPRTPAASRHVHHQAGRRTGQSLPQLFARVLQPEESNPAVNSWRNGGLSRGAFCVVELFVYGSREGAAAAGPLRGPVRAPRRAPFRPGLPCSTCATTSGESALGRAGYRVRVKTGNGKQSRALPTT